MQERPTRVATIESLDHDGQGVAHVDGKVVFIDGALTGETVTFQSWRRKPSFEQAQMTGIVGAESFMRVKPACPVFGRCGGCSMQHVDAAAQVAIKQRVLEDSLAHIGNVRAERILPAIQGQTWGYRHRARLAVRLVPKKGGMLVGFHEKRSSYIVDMQACPVLPPHVSGLILPLREMLGELAARERIPQIEVAVGDHVTVLVLRHLEPLGEADEATLRRFADRHQVQIHLQPGGPRTVTAFHPPDAPELSYSLPEFDVVMPFRPTEFTQVNPAVNRLMVARAMQLLDPQPGERVLDLFCGLGNFTLPIARRGAEVVGVEGDAALTERAVDNAVRNGLAGRARFQRADLFAVTPDSLAALGEFDKLLIDPPRDGAIEVVKALGANAPRRIVYVSCNPATLARDAGVLVHVHGYVLKAAGAINQFPHTAHTEAIAWFEKP